MYLRIFKAITIFIIALAIHINPTVKANAASDYQTDKSVSFDPVVFYGVYGQATKKAILNYKIDHRLDPNTVVASNMLTELGLDKWKNEKVKYREKGPVVWLIQQSLIEQGYFKDATIVKPANVHPSIMLPEYDAMPDLPDTKGNESQASVRKVDVKATAYTAHCPGCIGITKTGINLLENPSMKVIAVDPDVIPLGSTVFVPGYGYAIAGDTGGAIDNHHIDVYFASKERALQWGVKEITIKVIT